MQEWLPDFIAIEVDERLHAGDLVIGHVGQRPRDLVQGQADRDELLDVVERARVGDDEQLVVYDVDQPAARQVALRVGAELFGQVGPFHLHRAGEVGGAERLRGQPPQLRRRVTGLVQDSPDDVERKPLCAKRFDALDV
ncbi:hypothetical protein A5655_19485 [Mycobacterium sp. 1081908.1]|nr:hypothetical protein A5655_19485 [Mycobacterium sp. 1081908.1]